jgi:hypothetical protein
VFGVTGRGLLSRERLITIIHGHGVAASVNSYFESSRGRASSPGLPPPAPPLVGLHQDENLRRMAAPNEGNTVSTTCHPTVTFMYKSIHVHIILWTPSWVRGDGRF